MNKEKIEKEIESFFRPIRMGVYVTHESIIIKEYLEFCLRNEGFEPLRRHYETFKDEEQYYQKCLERLRKNIPNYIPREKLNLVIGLRGLFYDDLMEQLGKIIA